MSRSKFWKNLLWEVLTTILSLGLNQLLKEKKKEEDEDENSNRNLKIDY